MARNQLTGESSLRVLLHEQICSMLCHLSACNFDRRSLQRVPHSSKSRDMHSGEACQLKQQAETLCCCRPTANGLGTARSPASPAAAGPQLQQPLPNPATQLGQLLLSIHHASSPAAGQQQAEWHPASQLERRLCQSHVSQLSNLPEAYSSAFQSC